MGRKVGEMVGGGSSWYGPEMGNFVGLLTEIRDIERDNFEDSSVKEPAFLFVNKVETLTGEKVMTIDPETKKEVQYEFQFETSARFGRGSHIRERMNNYIQREMKDDEDFDEVLVPEAIGKRILLIFSKTNNDGKPLLSGTARWTAPTAGAGS